MNHLKQMLMALLTAFGISFITAVPLHATVGNYGIRPNYSSNQVVKNGQIDIFGTPGSTQNISISVVNKDTKDHRYTVTVNTAYTNNGGTYSYSKKKVSDPSLKIKLANLVSPRVQTVSVPAGKEVDVNFQIKIPKKRFSGYLMGGIGVQPAKGEKAYKTVAKNGTLLTNKFFQGVPLKVRQDKNSTMQPKFRARQVTAFANASGKGQRGVKANLQNYVKGFNGNINAKATVTKRPNDHKFKKTATLTGMSPAPNSNFDYLIDWGSTPLQAGNYHLHVKLTSSDKTQSWVVDKDFTITSADAGKYNKLSGIKPNYLWLWILIAVLVLLLVLGLGIYFGRRNNKKQN
ncbi:DUF916 and DUF3324 domain-containing protein [Bombilactobacillus folatiphilus]|uniref:DUF916 and DUF3324 domain-containing protein n=1 Tax=Bombilactobacillus folatiphilus TaxID=2923362 RepID=A0ABY4P831_9LACO|nr:DUF916 and DUF3324 domain-containing protein [Bombilactobacillus folatiphilus]UQS81859.1 DUF916 and DUF3324 domain-containing protein [Bombilactobacillus folatiphilus]